MDFRFSDEQVAMGQAVREALTRSCGLDVVRRVFNGDGHAAETVWGVLSRLGLPTLRLTEAAGGTGLGLVDAMLPLEEVGRACAPGPIAETIALAPLLVGTPMLGRLSGTSAGSLAVSTRSGSSALSHDADVFVLLDHGGGDSVLLLPRELADPQPQPSVDGARYLVQLKVPAASQAGIVSLPSGGRDALLATTTATSAVLLGLAQTMLDLSVTHANTREQFGQRIGAFQAVKHHLADAYVALAFARPVVYRAALSVDLDDEHAALHVSMAKAQASEAALEVARHALQVHGAIGYTTEYALHFYLKRAWALAQALGDARHHREVIASLLMGANEK